ncbi:hypothetical protein M8312_00450 [Sphingomonas sp. KRR8]|uniref:hypothetical protein n=1 Tax=Sphingomonas sp. KRR8 TaxID=2942996 RepID=UPI002021C2A5|nr:hypothetical protein [Sphingomonas sp. KRR8]URD61026.1 hypothetical protein M8312_00450 [Sphingomonas sp. KRR8]
MLDDIGERLSSTLAVPSASVCFNTQPPSLSSMLQAEGRGDAAACIAAKPIVNNANIHASPFGEGMVPS